MKTKLFKGIAIVGFLSLALVGCDKSDNDSPSQKNAMLDAFKLKHEAPLQKFTKSADGAFEINGKGGVKLNFPSGSLLDENDSKVTGPINLKLIEIFNKKDVLMSGLDTESYGSLLETGGQIFVEVEQDGKKLRLNPSVAVNVLFPRDPNQTTNNMILFVARPAEQSGESNSLTWAVYDKRQIPTTTNHYEFKLPELSWINIDRFINDNKPKTDISVLLDGSKATGNVSVELWIIFKDMKSAFKVQGLTTIGNYSNLLPVGENITLAVVGANEQGQLYIDSRDLITEVNKTYTMTPEPVTKAEMDAFILSLE